MDGALIWLLDVVRSVDPALRLLIAFAAMFCETSVLIGLVVPGDSIVILAGTTVHTIGDGILLGLVIVAGALGGESLGFVLGRLFGHRIRASRLGRRIGAQNWERADAYVRRRGGAAIFLSRFLPVLHSLVPLTVGMTDYSYRRFLAWTTPACVVWTTIYVSMAAFASGTYRGLSERIHGASYLFVGIVAVFIVVISLGKKLLLRLERRHLDIASEAPAASRAAEDMED